MNTDAINGAIAEAYRDYAKGQTLIFATTVKHAQAIHRVDVVFTHNLPANDLEASQMINNLAGKVTNETLIGQLGFVSDPKEEAALAREETISVAAETFTRKTEENHKLAEGGGY